MSSKKIVIDLRMIELGLAPESSSGTRLKKMLESLPPDESRKARRKFRKIWKKVLKEDPELARSVGAGKKKPSASEKRSRRAWVRRKIAREIYQE